jgi:hypothetical protein
MGRLAHLPSLELKIDGEMMGLSGVPDNQSAKHREPEENSTNHGPAFPGANGQGNPVELPLPSSWEVPEAVARTI